jgi:hypothetical protein
MRPRRSRTPSSLAVVARAFRGHGRAPRFREWIDTRLTPRPGGQDRTADRVAVLDEGPAPDRPCLLVVEFQSQHDPDKLDVTLHEAASLRLEVRHGPERRDKYDVFVGLIYLRGRCPEPSLQMTLPSGAGTRHVPLLWEVEGDAARDALDAVAAGAATWGMLFWVPLMRGGGDADVIARWRELVEALPDERRRSGLGQIALVFAELAGRYLAWEKGLEDFKMTESHVVNRWIERAQLETTLANFRTLLIRLLEGRFPGQTSQELIQTINEQPSVELLQEWFDQAASVTTMAEFLAVVRR